MKISILACISFATFSASAHAHGGMSAHGLSMAGQPPEVVSHEPDPHLLMPPFKVFLVDDGSCPAGQIKRFTRGSSRLQVRSVRECIPR